MAQSVKRIRIKRWLLSLGIAGAVSVIQLMLNPRPVEAGLLSVLETPVLPLDKIAVSLETPIVEVSVPVPAPGILPEPELPLLPAIEAEIPGVSVETPILGIDVPAIPVIITTEPAVPLPVPSPEPEPEPEPEPVAVEPLPVPSYEPAPSASPDEPDRREPAVTETPAPILQVTEEPPKPASGLHLRKPVRNPSLPAGTPEAHPGPAVETDRIPAAKSKEAGDTGPFPNDVSRRASKALARMPGSGTQGSGGTSIAPPGSQPYPPAFGYLSPGDTGKLPRMSIMNYHRFRIFGASQWSKPPPLQPPKTFLLI